MTSGFDGGEAGMLLMSTRFKDRLIAAALIAGMLFGAVVGIAISVAFWPFALFVAFVWFSSWRYFRLARFVSGWYVFENGVLVRRWGKRVFVPHSFDGRYFVAWNSRADEDSVTVWYSAKICHPAFPQIEVAALDQRAARLESAIRQGIERWIVPRLRRTWEAGDLVDFGVVRVSSEHVILGNRRQEWTQVQTVRLRRGKLEILSSAPGGPVRVAVNQISLAPVCLALISSKMTIAGAKATDLWDGL